MKLMVSILMVVSSLLMTTEGRAQKPIENFSSLMSVLNSGGGVKAVFHYSKCKLIMNGEESDWKPDAIGGMSIDVYEYFAKGAVRNDRAYVVFSENKLIENPIGDGYVYNYAKVRVYEDGEVIIYVRYLGPQDFSENMNEEFHTTIKTVDNDAGAYFFSSQE